MTSPQTSAAQSLRMVRQELDANVDRAFAAEATYPDADAMNDEQTAAAIARLHENTATYPEFPWPSLADVAGPLCPEDLVIIAARTSQGKSLFLQNLFDALIASGIAGLYIGLEQGPDVLRSKWACIRCGVRPSLVLAPKKHERGSPEWEHAMSLVQEDIRDYQSSATIKRLAHFSATRRVNAKKLLNWTEWAVDHGCGFVIVDHIDRMQHGDGKNTFHELSETVRLAKELAVKHRIVMLVASQIGRPSDSVEALMPPMLHNLRGAGTKEEEADTVLGVYRPLRLNVTDKELKAVRQAAKPIDEVREPNTMAVMLLKHRLDGAVAGRVVKLGVHHQRVAEIAEKDRWTTAHGRPDQLL
jgi:hypothetical protein